MKNQKGITLIALIITILVMLILAAVTISLVIDEDGVLSKAQSATSKMNKAEIEEKANLTKLEYETDCYTNKNLKKSIQELRNKIIEAFEVTEDTNNDNIIEINDKYAIHIKNTDLDIEVVEITDALKASSLLSITYKVNEIVNEGKNFATNIDWTISQIETDSLAEKETLVVQKLGEKYGKSFNDLDEAIVGIVNVEFKQNFKEINECLTGLNTTRENLYYAFYYNGSLTNQISKNDFIERSYKELCNYINYKNYILSVIIEDSIETIEKEIQLEEVPYTFNFGNFINNTVYKIVLKNVSGDVVASEVVHVRNIDGDIITICKNELEKIFVGMHFNDFENKTVEEMLNNSEIITNTDEIRLVNMGIKIKNMTVKLGENELIFGEDIGYSILLIFEDNIVKKVLIYRGT